MRPWGKQIMKSKLISWTCIKCFCYSPLLKGCLKSSLADENHLKSQNLNLCCKRAPQILGLKDSFKIGIPARLQGPILQMDSRHAWFDCNLIVTRLTRCTIKIIYLGWLYDPKSGPPGLVLCIAVASGPQIQSYAIC